MSPVDRSTKTNVSALLTAQHKTPLGAHSLLDGVLHTIKQETESVTKQITASAHGAPSAPSGRFAAALEQQGQIAKTRVPPIPGALASKSGFGGLDSAAAPEQAAVEAMGAHNDDVLFLGLNPTAGLEIAALRREGANVVAVTNAAKPDTILVAGKLLDLADTADLATFVSTLGLPSQQAEQVSAALQDAEPNSRDELAHIAQVWAAAEHGGPSPTRMLISSHYADDGPMGDENGNFTWDSLAKLAQALPAGSRRIEDLHVSACSTGGDVNKQRLAKIFPTLRSHVWAYNDSAPGAASGAAQHQAAWERATRGLATDVEGAKADLVRRGVRKAKNIDVAATGTSPPAALRELRAKVAEMEEVFQPYFTGDDVVTKEVREYGKLRQYYASMQPLAQHPLCPEDERKALEGKRSQTIRLLYYDKIKAKFEKAYKEQIQSGFAQLGLKEPNFAKLSRKQALNAIGEFDAALAAASPTPAASLSAAPLLKGLAELQDKTVIPRNWL